MKSVLYCPVLLEDIYDANKNSQTGECCHTRFEWASQPATSRTSLCQLLRFTHRTCISLDVTCDKEFARLVSDS